jgi:predicted PurR-regulated permease PerM
VEERLVRFRATTVLAVLGIAIAVGILLEIIWIARHILTWILIAAFLTLALNPAVEWFQRHGVKRRGAATAITVLLTLFGLAALGALFVPTLVHEVNGFAKALPGYIDDITHRRGRLGFLESKYHITRTYATSSRTAALASCSG